MNDLGIRTLNYFIIEIFVKKLKFKKKIILNRLKVF